MGDSMETAVQTAHFCAAGAGSAAAASRRAAALLRAAAVSVEHLSQGAAAGLALEVACLETPDPVEFALPSRSSVAWPPGLAPPACSLWPRRQLQPAGANCMSRRSCEQDLACATGIPPPYRVVMPDTCDGYKVHVGGLFQDLERCHQRGFIDQLLLDSGCALPCDFEVSQSSGVILTFLSVSDAQRARRRLDGLAFPGAELKADFWVPHGYNAWATDTRFKGVPVPRARLRSAAA